MLDVFNFEGKKKEGHFLRNVGLCLSQVCAKLIMERMMYTKATGNLTEYAKATEEVSDDELAKPPTGDECVELCICLNTKGTSDLQMLVSKMK